MTWDTFREIIQQKVSPITQATPCQSLAGEFPNKFELVPVAAIHRVEPASIRESIVAGRPIADFSK